VIIELEADGGPPRGRIRIDGGRQRDFYGWIDLTAHLESLTERASPPPRDPDTRVQRGV
jgi:hypothetical protein